MKFYKFKTVVGLTLGSAVVISLAACGSGSDVAPVETETETSPITIAAGPLEAKEVLFAMDGSERQATPTPIEAGMLVKGSSTLIYYVTDDGTLRPIPDHDTFEAFGFSPQEVMVVDDDVLSTMPVDDTLTRYLFDSVGTLFWVAKGQRWGVNEWKDMINDSSHADMVASQLDGSLSDRLPIRNLHDQLVRGQSSRVYYYVGRTITPLPIDYNYDETKILNLPDFALDIYTLQKQLKIAWTTLNNDTQAANVRSGPGVNFEIIGTIDKTDDILVIGQAENSNWLLVKYWGQNAWLAGDLIQDQYLLNLFRPVNFEPVTTQESKPLQTAETYTYANLGAIMIGRDGFPVVISLQRGAPAGQAGLAVGDIIIQIDGVDVTTLSLDEAFNRIRGKKGTEINLMVRRPNTNERLGIAIVRGGGISPVQTPTCRTQPIRGFGTVWLNHPEVRQWLGCPFTNFRRNEHATKAAVQIFQHGWMLWLETDTVANVDPIYVFFEDDHSYYRFGDRELADAHSFAPTPQGFYKVGDRFAKVYWEELGEHNRKRLGYATNEARDSQGAFQEFQNGRMFWAGEADTIYVIYQGTRLNSAGKTTSLQSWTSYEDTFEDPPEN